MLPLTYTFYTTCRGRLHNLREAYPASLGLLQGRPHMDAVLLDYNSQDGLAEWVAGVLQPYLASGKLRYYRTIEPQRFFAAHAKNVAAKLCTASIVGNLDADNLLTSSYLDRLQVCFEQNSATVTHGRRSAWGRVVMPQAAFQAMHGYNERMSYGWGTEDRDLIRRGEIFGLRRLSLSKSEDICALKNTPEERAADYLIRDPGESRRLHNEISGECIREFGFFANPEGVWGRARLTKNFTEELEV
jgi:hypothetical protein